MWTVVLVATTAAAVVASPRSAQATPVEWLDGTYGGGGIGGLLYGESVIDGTVDSLGRALVLTAFEFNGTAVPRLRRLSVAGAEEITFTGGVLSQTTDTTSFVVHADSGGTVTVAGAVTGVGVVVTRYTAAGVPDTTFGGGDGSVTAVSSGGFAAPIRIVERTSGLLISGVTPDNETYYFVTALTHAGALDPSWAPGAAVPGILTSDDGTATLAADGDFVVGYNMAGSNLVRMTPAGDLDLTLGGVGFVPLPVNLHPVGATVVGDDYLLYGSYWAGDENYALGMAIAKYSDTGVLDTSFGADGIAARALNPCYSNAGTLSLVGGFIYLVGSDICDWQARSLAVRFTMDGDLDISYGVAGEILVDEMLGYSVYNEVALGAQPDGRVLALFEAGPEEWYGPRTGVVRLRLEPAGPPATEPGAFVPLSPSRILDTRVGNGAPAGKVPAFGTLELQVAGRGGVPADGAAAVVLNVTATEPGGPGYITAYPTGTEAPLASNLNVTAGQTIPNLVTVKLGTDGKVSLKNGSGAGVHLIADVAGYYLDGEPTEPGTFVSLDPTRLLDTRFGNGAPTGKLPASGTLDLQVAGRGGVPADGAGAVVLNVTVTEPGSAGYLTVYPSGVAAPLASNLNFTPGQTIPNLVTVKLGDDGQVSLKNGGVAGLHVIADVAGYYLDGEATEPGTFVPLSPSRLLDTRFGTGAPVGKVPGLASLNLQVAGSGGVPSTTAAAVILNVTVTEPGSAGYVTAYPTAGAPPLASNLNFTTGLTIPNLVAVKLGDAGQVSLTNGGIAGVHLIADVAGYFLS